MYKEEASFHIMKTCRIVNGWSKTWNGLNSIDQESTLMGVHSKLKQFWGRSHLSVTYSLNRIWRKWWPDDLEHVAEKVLAVVEPTNVVCINMAKMTLKFKVIGPLHTILASSITVFHLRSNGDLSIIRRQLSKGLTDFLCLF